MNPKITPHECTKAKFSDENSALEFIQAKVRYKKGGQTLVSAYLCEFCLSWHVTSNEWLFKKRKEFENLIAQKDKRIAELEKLNDVLINGDSKYSNHEALNIFRHHTESIRGELKATLKKIEDAKQKR